MPNIDLMLENIAKVVRSDKSKQTLFVNSIFATHTRITR